MNQAEIDELTAAGIAKDQKDIAALRRALEATLWVLEHPEVNAINFCGSPRHLVLEVRALLARQSAP
jgi:hypothetical protein